MFLKCLLEKNVFTLRQQSEESWTFMLHLVLCILESEEDLCHRPLAHR